MATKAKTNRLAPSPNEVNQSLHGTILASRKPAQIFENLKDELLTPELVAGFLHTTRGTVYQWHSRPKRYGIPDGLFLKLGRKLLIRRDVLVTWVFSRGS